MMISFIKEKKGPTWKNICPLLLNHELWLTTLFYKAE